MTDTTKGKLDSVLKKIQGLIAKADSTEFPEEAATFRAKAEQMMHIYRIEESMLAAAAPAGSGLSVVWASWHVCQMGNPFAEYYREIASWIIHHVGAQAIITHVHDKETGEYWLSASVVGYESDLRYGEMLLTSALLAFGQRLEPTYDPEESEQVNAYRFRRAGMEAKRISEIFWGPHKKGRATKIVNLYKAEAVARGEDPSELSGNNVNVKTYRESYAKGFSREMWNRLHRMRYTASEESQALVIAGRADAVKEAFYEKYPMYRPDPNADIASQAEECAKCAKAKGGYCRDHAWLRPRAPKAERVNDTAAQRGREAAREVDLGTTGRITS